MLRQIRRLNDFSPKERALLLQLVIFSLAVVACIRWVSLNRLVRFVSSSVEYPLLKHFPLLHEGQEWTRLVTFSDMAARFARGEDRCLVRSLILLWLLKARREPAELVIGVCNEASDFNSHAWVECRGQVMGDSAAMVGRFASMLRL